MIKLIVSDLDGTLLLPDKKLPEEIFEIVPKLYDKGIIFAPASGRQLPNLKKMFAPVIDKIAIIAENGGLAYFGGEVIYTNPTPKNQAAYALDIIEKQDGLYPLLSCVDCAYYTSDYPEFVAAVNKSYDRAEKIDSFKSVVSSVTALKISIWDRYPPASVHGSSLLNNKIEGMRTMVSGHEWLDVSTSSANKSEALKALFKHMHIERENCLAFGDHMNDLEMLLFAGNSYITANAFHFLQDKFPKVKSNAEKGVIEKLRELL